MEQEIDTNALGGNRKKIKTIYDPEIPVIFMN
jgi:hypothetical protein